MGSWARKYLCPSGTSGVMLWERASQWGEYSESVWGKILIYLVMLTYEMETK